MYLQYIPRNMHTVFALLCFVVVIHWLIYPYPSGLLHWHCGNLTIVPVPAKQPWWIWINTSCEFIMNDCITTTKQCTTKPCAYFLGYTVLTPRTCGTLMTVSILMVSIIDTISYMFPVWATAADMMIGMWKMEKVKSGWRQVNRCAVMLSRNLIVIDVHVTQRVRAPP